MPRAVEITEENLEDLLAYDDLFLDYFNAFLSLPVFPQPLHYNRLTGTFIEEEASASALSLTRPITPPYGATDEERDHMLEWARQERLPLFLKTELFREFKLCKLLLRVLSEDRFSAGRRSSRYTIRGYSRQTESYVSSLSNSADNSANDDLDDDNDYIWGDPHQMAMYQRRLRRPGSRAISLPTRLGLAPVYSSVSSESSRDTETKQTSSNSDSNKHHASADSGNKAHSKDTLDPVSNSSGIGTSIPNTVQREATFTTRNDTLVSIGERGNQSCVARSVRSTSSRSFRSRRSSAAADNASKLEKQDDAEKQVYSDYDAAFGEDEPEPDGDVYVAFADDVVSDSQTENDVRHLEGKHKMTIQEMKEQILGTVEGMESFRSFLADTAGIHLINFWLDCENFKDTMEEYDEEENIANRNRLFRDIQDRYKMNLTSDAKDRLLRSASNTSLSYTVFIRTQYDVLRRLRTYWLPRFLIHKERMDELRVELKRDLETSKSLDYSQLASCFFPSISLVNSMPVRPEDVMQIAKTTNWEAVSKGGRKLDDRIKSAKPRPVVPPVHQNLKEKLILALSADRAAGGPFKTFLARQDDMYLLSNLLFWEDVTEYGAAEDRSADRLLRMVHAWHIFNKYISIDGPNSIGADPGDRDKMHQQLLTSRDFIAASLFNPAKEQAVALLEKAWVRYLKEDLKTFIDCHIRPSHSPPSTAEEIEVTFDEHRRLIVRRPWVRRKDDGNDDGYPPSTDSERGRRLRTALSMAESIDEARRAEQRARAKEKRKIMEKERKKAIRNARMRQKEAKSRKNVQFKQKQEEEEKPEEENPEENAEIVEEQKAPEFISSISNKGLISLFKKYLTENQGREVINIVNMYLDIEAYLGINHTDKNGKQKKDIQAGFIFKTYMEQGARKKVLMSDKVYNRLKAEKERPKTPTLKDAQHHILPQLESYFSKFWEIQSDELGPDKLAAMSKAEMAMRTEDPGLLTSWKKKGKGGKQLDLETEEPSNQPQYIIPKKRKGKKKKPDGRAQPTNDDKMDFLVALHDAAAGHLPTQMLYFYKYLVKHGEEDGFPLIDKDMFFYCEVKKFKDAHHAYSDEEMLKRKVQSIMDCYLESATPPALQIDISSDLQQRTLRQAQRYVAGKDVNATVFDDAQYQVFKELLPFWAGFVKKYEPPQDETKKPLTRLQRDRLRRLEEIQHWKPPSARTAILPSLPKGSTVAALTFTLMDGVKWRDMDMEGHPVTGDFEGDMEEVGLTAATNMGRKASMRRGSILSVPSSIISDAPSNNSTIVSKA